MCKKYLTEAFAFLQFNFIVCFKEIKLSQISYQVLRVSLKLRSIFLVLTIFATPK